MEDGMANWQWLAHLPNRETALLLVRRSDSEDWHLTQGFASTRRVITSDSWSQDIPPHSVDCVAVPDAAALRSGAAPIETLLAAAHRVLRPGSGVYVGIESIHEGSSRSLMGARRARRHAQARLLTNAGFRDIREYYVVQSPAAPRHIVPVNATALKVWERAVSERGWRAQIRSALYSLGAESVLMRYRMVIAHA
jgi:hypothetical protein